MMKSKRRILLILGIIVVILAGIAVAIKLAGNTATKETRLTAYLDKEQMSWIPLSLNDSTTFSWSEDGNVTVRFDETSGPLDIECTIVPDKTDLEAINNGKSIGLQESISVPVQKEIQYEILVKSSSNDFASGTIWCELQFEK